MSEHLDPAKPDSPAAPAPDTPSAPASGALTEDVVKATLRRVKDPELNLNIVDLGLVYAVTVDGGLVTVDVTLTSPGCPSGPEILGTAEQTLRGLPGVEDVVMNLVWDPMWSPDRMEPRIKAYLGF
ncbi:MAG: metal-sulfur cluster assembly factor [Gemmatimonadaceae bacterium]